jgi:hypothetical protein
MDIKATTETSTEILTPSPMDSVCESTFHVKKARGGGTACCVPECGNNTRKSKNISFHKFPKDQKLRNKWIHWIGRKHFTPNEQHRVCSDHFPGGTKTYLNNVPTITPKRLQPTPTKARQTYKCRERTPLADLKSDMNNESIPENTSSKVNEKENLLQSEVQRLEHELLTLKLKYEHDMNELKQELRSTKFSVDRFKTSDADFEFYTGFQSYAKFKAFFAFLSPACTKLTYRGSRSGCIESEDQQKRGRKRSLCPEEELFLVLSRLRCGLLEKDLAFRYNISVSQVSNIWITWLDFLCQRLRSIPIWPSRECVNSTMPKSFKEHYPQTRIIIDCTEIFIEMPSAPVSQSITFSTYKHHNTAKGLIGISPSGMLTFVSDLYAGRASDKELTKDCGILTLLEEGDQIMADRGFTIDDCLPAGVTLNIPPFLDGKSQFCVEDEVKTRRIARQRIHVERAIEKIKNFRILQQPIPISMAADANKVWIICSYLTLFSKPLVLSDNSD